MNPRTLAAGLAVALLATLLAPVNFAAPAAPSLPTTEIHLSASSLKVPEAGSASYAVTLTSAPLGTVTVALALGAGSDLTLSAASLSFSPTDFSNASAHTVTVTGRAENTAVDGTHVAAITHTANSTTDSRYKGKTASLTAYSADNDVGLSVQTDGPVTINENPAAAGAKDTLAVSLGRQPSGTVTVKLVPSDTQFDVDRHTLTFGAGNWFVPVTVNVSAYDDDVVEGTQARSIAVTTSGPGSYSLVPAQTIAVTILDDDMAGLRFTNATGAVLAAPVVLNPGARAGPVAETNGTVYGVALSSKPSATVTIALSDPSGQVTVSPASLTFGAGNWSTAKPVTVTGKNDAVDEGSNTVAVNVAIVHNPSSSDADYNALADVAATFRHFDDDTAGYIFSGGAINATPTLTPAEATPAAPVTYTVRLSSQPVGDVTVGFAGNAQVTVAPASYRFGASNWTTARTVTVTAVDDKVAEDSPHTTFVTQTVSSADPRYQAIPASVKVNVTDNDLPSLVVVQSGSSTTVVEGGANDTFTVKLASQPTDPVTVSLTSSDLNEIAVTPASLTFTAANWNAVQTATVEAVDDSASEFDEHLNVTIAVDSNDGKYDGLTVPPVPVLVLDNDGVATIAESDGSTVVLENGTADSYTIRLIQPPTDPVTIKVHAPDGLLVNGETDVNLTFDPNPAASGRPLPLADVLDAVDGVLQVVGLDPVDRTPLYQPWNAPQTVLVTATEDPSVEGSQTLNITHVIVSDDPHYGGAFVRNVPAYRLDNDPGVLVRQTGGGTAVTEGAASDTYTVRLATRPVDGVAVQLHHDGQVSVSDNVLYFDPYAWDFDQAVTVTAVVDHVDEANTVHSVITHDAFSPNDVAYDGIPVASVDVTVNDSDTAGITLAQSGGNTAVAEGGAADSYTLVLTSMPPGPVTIGLTATPSGQLTTPSAVTFTTSNWNVPQTVSVQAVDDSVAEGAMTVVIHHTVTGFPGVTVADVAVPVTDNDVAGLLVTETNGNTVVIEGGLGDGINFRLSSQPTADVFVSLATSDTRLQMPAPLKFDATTWSQVQQVWVWSHQDTTAQGTGPSVLTVTVTSADPNYGDLPVSPASVTVVDDDTASLVATDTNGATVVTEGGAGDSFVVRLSKAPTADVTVTLASAGGQVTLSPTTLTFTAANYNAPQTVSVAAVNDAVAEGAHSATVTFSLSSSDGAYNGLSAPSKTVSIVDND